LLILAALYSGGKDSTLALYLAEQMGHRVTHLVNIVPGDPHSWLFHTPNLHLVPVMAESMGKQLVAVRGGGDEESDLRALREALTGLDVDGVVTGAVASDYQWDRINGVCEELGLKTISPLWRKDPDLVMDELMDSGIEAIIVGVFADGLNADWLGRTLDKKALDELRILRKRYGINVAGEGGEYETLTLDSPLHRNALHIDAHEIRMSQLAGVMDITSYHTKIKKAL